MAPRARRRKILTSGQIKKTKTHAERGLLVSSERRSRIMLWRLEVFKRLMPAATATMRWCVQEEEAFEERREARKAFAAKYEAEARGLRLLHGVQPSLESLKTCGESLSRCPVRMEPAAMAYSATLGVHNATPVGESGHGPRAT